MITTVRRVNSKVNIIISDLFQYIEGNLETDDKRNRLYFLKGGGSHEI